MHSISLFSYFIFSSQTASGVSEYRLLAYTKQYQLRIDSTFSKQNTEEIRSEENKLRRTQSKTKSTTILPAKSTTTTTKTLFTEIKQKIRIAVRNKGIGNTNNRQIHKQGKRRRQNLRSGKNNNVRLQMHIFTTNLLSNAF